MRRHDLQGELRGLMQRERLAHRELAELWSLILDAFTRDRDRYKSQLLPYLTSFPQHFSRGSLTMFERLDELEFAAQIIPCARFHLVLDRGARGKNLTALLKSTAASNVRRLTLTGDRITPSRLRRLACAEALPNLVELDLAHHEIGPQGACALTTGALFGQLEELCLAQCYIARAGLEALLSYPTPWQLTALDLRHNALDDEAIDRLAASRQVARLKRLALDHNDFCVRGQRALADSPYLDARLRRPWAEALARHETTP